MDVCEGLGLTGPAGHAHRALSRHRPKLTSLTGGNFFLHSRDKARKSLCIFSSSFFTASGLLVPDMIHQAPSQFPSRANELRHCQILGTTGSTLLEPPALPLPTSWALPGLCRASAAYSERARALPAAPSQLPRLLSEALPAVARPR